MPPLAAYVWEEKARSFKEEGNGIHSAFAAGSTCCLSPPATSLPPFLSTKLHLQSAPLRPNSYAFALSVKRERAQSICPVLPSPKTTHRFRTASVELMTVSILWWMGLPMESLPGCELIRERTSKSNQDMQLISDDNPAVLEFISVRKATPFCFIGAIS